MSHGWNKRGQNGRPRSRLVVRAANKELHIVPSAKPSAKPRLTHQYLGSVWLGGIHSSYTFQFSHHVVSNGSEVRLLAWAIISSSRRSVFCRRNPLFDTKYRHN